MKLTIHKENPFLIVYDHDNKQYAKYDSLSAIQKRYPQAFAKKLYREISTPHTTPLKVFFDPTRQCNSRCIHCYNDSGKKLEKEVDIPFVENLAKTLSSLGICQISIAGGEPFLRKDILEILNCFHKHLIDISITTNGLCFTEKNILPLQDYGVKSITVSIDGIDRKSYREIRGIDAFDVLNKNLDLLRKNFSGELAMRFSVMKNNCNPQKILNYAVSKAFDTLKVNKTHLLGRFEKCQDHLIDDISYDDIIAKFHQLKETFPIALELPREKYLNKESPLPCSAGKKTLYISPQGEVFPCPFIPSHFIFGNLKNSPLSDILIQNRDFTVNNSYCHQCPAMKKSHNITQKSLLQETI